MNFIKPPVVHHSTCLKRAYYESLFIGLLRFIVTIGVTFIIIWFVYALPTWVIGVIQEEPHHISIMILISYIISMIIYFRKNEVVGHWMEHWLAHFTRKEPLSLTTASIYKRGCITTSILITTHLYADSKCLVGSEQIVIDIFNNISINISIDSYYLKGDPVYMKNITLQDRTLLRIMYPNLNWVDDDVLKYILYT